MMPGAEPIRIFAAVTQTEQPAIVAGAELLRNSIGSARPDGQQPVKVTLGEPGSAPRTDQPPHFIITSLLAEVQSPDEDDADILARWSDYLGDLQNGDAGVLLCTVFRHVPERERSGSSNPTLHRIRKLNYLAVQLSHVLGVGVIDIDRIMAYFGARTLRTDYRLTGPVTAEVAGYAIASALFAYGMDDLVDPLLQEKAVAYLGEPENVPALIRQLQEQRRRKSDNAAAKNG